VQKGRKDVGKFPCSNAGRRAAGLLHHEGKKKKKQAHVGMGKDMTRPPQAFTFIVIRGRGGWMRFVSSRMRRGRYMEKTWLLLSGEKLQMPCSSNSV